MPGRKKVRAITISKIERGRGQSIFFSGEGLKTDSQLFGNERDYFRDDFFEKYYC